MKANKQHSQSFGLTGLVDAKNWNKKKLSNFILKLAEKAPKMNDMQRKFWCEFVKFIAKELDKNTKPSVERGLC